MLVEIVSRSTVEKITFDNLLKKNWKTILYFYPKDNTPWCSTEATDFNSIREDLNTFWYKIIWVSKDSIESHKKFIENKDLHFSIISDINLDLHKQFWVYWEKNNYWKLVMWIIRSTFLLDWTNIIKERRNIKAKWHANKVYDFIKNI